MENLEWKDKVDGQDDILAEDINAIANYANELNDGKVDKVDGKDLSSNDFTDDFKSMLENVDTEGFESDSSDLITSGAVAHSVLTLAQNLSDAIPSIDEELSTDSLNPVQNKAVATKLNVHDDMLTAALTAIYGMEEGIVYRSDLQKTFDTIINNDGEEIEYPEIEAIANAFTEVIYNGENIGYAPVTLKLKDTKAREMISNIPMQKIYETTTTEAVVEITDDTLTNLKLDEIYVYIKLSSALTESNKTWNCEINGVENASSNYLFYFTANTTGTHFFVKGERMCENLWFTQKTSNLATGVNNQTLYASYNMNGVNYINSLKFNCQGLPAGSTITVCGRKVLE